MEVRMAAGVALVLISMILGACVCACKITFTEGVGCFPQLRLYDRVVTLDGDDEYNDNDSNEGTELVVTINKLRE